VGLASFELPFSSSGSSSSNTSAIGDALVAAEGLNSNGTNSGALSVLRWLGVNPLALCIARR
jgi:hypothetical protein